MFLQAFVSKIHKLYRECGDVNPRRNIDLHIVAVLIWVTVIILNQS